MAHETLKTLITNNIKTNGQNAITAQILQDVLIAMVDEYPDISGYATRSWVSQQLGGYLPLTGGNLDGNLSIYDTMNIYSSSIEWNDSGDYSRIAFDQDGITVTAHGTGYVIANEFIRNGGTSSQFLKADGSVDENTYATESALLGYLPLTGGTMTGALNFNSSDYKIDFITASGVPALQLESAHYIYLSAGEWIELMADNISCWGNVHAQSFIKNNGTADQVLCADGSVKTLSELKAALNAI